MVFIAANFFLTKTLRPKNFGFFLVLGRDFPMPIDSCVKRNTMKFLPRQKKRYRPFWSRLPGFLAQIRQIRQKHFYKFYFLQLIPSHNQLQYHKKKHGAAPAAIGRKNRPGDSGRPRARTSTSPVRNAPKPARGPSGPPRRTFSSNGINISSGNVGL